MKTQRTLDGLLETVRRHPPSSRLVAREEIPTMIDRAGITESPTQRSSRWQNRRLTMTAAGLSLVAGVCLWLASGESTTEPSALAAVGATTAPGETGQPAHDSTPQLTQGSTEGGAQSSRPNESVADHDESGALQGERSDRTSDDGTKRNRYDGPSWLAESARIHADGSVTLNPESADPPKKPEIPSGGMIFQQTTLDSAEIARREESRTTDRALDIKGLGFLELSSEEAARIGVIVRDGSLELLADDMKDAQIRTPDSDDRITLSGSEGSPLKRFKLEIALTTGRVAPIEIAEDEKPLAIAPVVIVVSGSQEDRETSSLIYFQNAPTLGLEQRDIFGGESLHRRARTLAQPEGLAAVMSRELLGKLVPVYFHLDFTPEEGSQQQAGADVCLWYSPTKEFIAALPERYRSSLETELTTIRQVADANGTIEEACDRIAGKPSYLEVCRVSSGAVNTAVATPNPAQGRTTVGFRLNESRHVSITLHDVNGRYLRHLLYEEERSAGDQRVEVDLNGVSQGAYLVAVRTSQGEQAVARLIVQ